MTVVGGLVGCGGGVAGAVGDALVEPAVVEPVDVGHGGELDVLEAVPGALAVDQLPLVEPVERLGEAVVIAVALRSDRRDDVVDGEPVGVANRQVLDSAIAVMHEPREIVASALALPDRHLERVDRQIRPQ